MDKVFLITPYSAQTIEAIERNIDYAREATHKLLVTNNAVFASHLLYTQPNVLDDRNLAQRSLGMKAGQEFLKVCDYAYVGLDLGISKGMIEDCNAAIENDIPLAFCFIRKGAIHDLNETDRNIIEKLIDKQLVKV